MAKEPILSAKDVEIQFSLRGKLLTAIRRCSLDPVSYTHLNFVILILALLLAARNRSH